MKRLALAVVAMWGLGGALALAQSTVPAPIHNEGDTFVLEALGHRLTLPIPEWLDGEPDRLAAVDALFTADERQALLEILPKGDDPVDWSTLLAARIMLEPERRLEDYRQIVMLSYAQTCQASLTGFFQLGEDDGEVLAPLGFVCGAHLDRLEGFAGRGQVAIISFKRSDQGIATIYQEWRGRAFDPANPSAWPVPTATVELQARQLQTLAALLPADD